MISSLIMLQLVDFASTRPLIKVETLCRHSTIDPRLVVTAVSEAEQVDMGSYCKSGCGKLGIGGLVHYQASIDTEYFVVLRYQDQVLDIAHRYLSPAHNPLPACNERLFSSSQ